MLDAVTSFSFFRILPEPLSSPPLPYPIEDLHRRSATTFRLQIPLTYPSITYPSLYIHTAFPTPSLPSNLGSSNVPSGTIRHLGSTSLLTYLPTRAKHPSASRSVTDVHTYIHTYISTAIRQRDGTVFGGKVASKMAKYNTITYRATSLCSVAWRCFNES